LNSKKQKFIGKLPNLLKICFLKCLGKKRELSLKNLNAKEPF